MISTQIIKEKHQLSWAEAKVVHRGVSQNQIEAFRKRPQPITNFVAFNLPNHSSKRKKEVRNAINLELRPVTI